MGAGAIIVLIVFAGFAFWIGQTRLANFEAELTQAVAERGGTVLRVDRPWFSNGPWLFRGKGQLILKVVYRDRAGYLRQLWGRTGTFSNDIDWDYDDGDYGGGV